MSHGHTGPSGATIFSPVKPVNRRNPACRSEACLFYRGEQLREKGLPTCPTHGIMLDWDGDKMTDFCPLCRAASASEGVQDRRNDP